jgi:hypothetical protein
MITQLGSEEHIRLIYYKLIHYKNDFHDEIPSETVHQLSPDGQYKCRIGWWQNLSNKFSLLEAMGILPEEIGRKYHQLIDRYQRKIRQNAFGVSAEEIKDANELLSKVIDTLEAKLDQNPN